MSVVAGTVVIESPRAVVRTSRSRTHIPNTTYCRRAGLLGPGPDNGSQSIRIRVGWRAGDGLAHCSLLPEVAQRETEEEQEFSFHGRSGGSLAAAHPCGRWGSSHVLEKGSKASRRMAQWHISDATTSPPALPSSTRITGIRWRRSGTVPDDLPTHVAPPGFGAHRSEGRLHLD